MIYICKYGRVYRYISFMYVRMLCVDVMYEGVACVHDMYVCYVCLRYG